MVCMFLNHSIILYIDCSPPCVAYVLFSFIVLPMVLGVMLKGSMRVKILHKEFFISLLF